MSSFCFALAGRFRERPPTLYRTENFAFRFGNPALPKNGLCSTQWGPGKAAIQTCGSICADQTPAPPGTMRAGLAVVLNQQSSRVKSQHSRLRFPQALTENHSQIRLSMTSWSGGNWPGRPIRSWNCVRVCRPPGDCEVVRVAIVGLSRHPIGKTHVNGLKHVFHNGTKVLWFL